MESAGLVGCSEELDGLKGCICHWNGGALPTIEPSLSLYDRAVLHRPSLCPLTHDRSLIRNMQVDFPAPPYDAAAELGAASMELRALCWLPRFLLHLRDGESPGGGPAVGTRMASLHRLTGRDASYSF